MLENEREFHQLEESNKAVWADETSGELRQEAMIESGVFQKWRGDYYGKTLWHCGI